jgi:hypothetical protein
MPRSGSSYFTDMILHRLYPREKERVRVKMVLEMVMGRKAGKGRLKARAVWW